jgi:hypothetical protein
MRRALLLVAGFGGLLSLKAWGAPSLTADRPVDAPSTAPALQDQQTPAIAFGAGEYLAVWRDGTTSAWTINGTRLDLTGRLLDDPPIAISGMRGEFETPAVAFDGQRFLVVWVGSAAAGLGVHGVYVTPEGVVGTPFSITTIGSGQPAVAAGDGFALVTWSDVNSSDVYATLFDQNGAVINMSKFALSNTNVDTGDGNPPAVNPVPVWGGATANNFLVTWTEGLAPNRVVMATTVETNATVSPAPFAVNTLGADAAGQAATRSGDQFFVTWVDRREGVAMRSLYGRTVTPLAVLGTEFLVADPPSPQPIAAYLNPQTVSIADRALVVWESLDPATAGFRLYGARVAPDGSSHPDGNGVLISSAPPAIQPLLPSLTDSRRAALASDGSHAFAVWQHASSGVTGYDVLALPVDPSPTPLPVADSLLLGVGANYEVSRSVASDGNVFLLVWEDDRNAVSSGVDILGLRVDLDGTPIDTAPFVICNAPGDQFQPTVAAYLGGDFLVVWADGRALASGGDVDLYATRVGATGGPLDGNGFVVNQGPNAQLWPTVAAANDGWLVAWEDWRNVTDNNPGIWATKVSSAGVPAAEITLVDPIDLKHQACAPAAAYNGQHFFVAYEQPCSQLSALAYSSPPPPADLFGQWLSSSGALVGTPVTLAALAGAESAPRLAADGTQIALVWRDQTGGEFIRAGRIADNAASLSGAIYTAASGPGTREAPAVAAANGIFLISWVESSPPSVKAVRTDSNLMPLEPLNPTFVLSPAATLRVPLITVPPGLNGAGAAAAARVSPPGPVAAASTGEALATYDLLENNGTVSRLHYRKLALLPRGATCNGAGGCADGICARGICCDTACDVICQACNANGCVETPPTDDRCGASGPMLACTNLSTACRTYENHPLNQCFAFGECAEAGSLAECDRYTNAADGTACSSAACAGGSCSAGVCECAGGGLPAPSPRTLMLAQATGGCDVCGDAAVGSGPAFLLLLLCLLGTRRLRLAKTRS